MDENVIKNEIEQGIAQVDSSLTISEFGCDFDKSTRKLIVSFTARNSNDEMVEVKQVWD